eukprot:COSAG02_NODE_1215_length_13852_cov_10.082600_8_plen_398_part_00
MQPIGRLRPQRTPTQMPTRIAALMGLALFMCVSLTDSLRTTSIDTSSGTNKFGMGVYGTVPLVEQLPWALNLAGNGGRVLLYMTLSFSENGNVRSCGECTPSAEEVAALHQAYALGLRPVVRIGQLPRTIRDFSDDAEHLVYTSLAEAYRTFAAALPLPTDGNMLEVILQNEPQAHDEWMCSGSGYLTLNTTAGEVAGCVRDTMAALRTLPRLLLSPPPVTRVAPMSYPCIGNPSGKLTGYQLGTDFIRAMLRAVPGLYAHAGFFNAHPYPIHNEPFQTPKGRAGVISYRAQLNATGNPSLPVLITECGWSGDNETEKATSFVAALQEEWLPDPRVVGVMPFLLTGGGGQFTQRGWDWVMVPPRGSAGQPFATQQYNATRALRCIVGVGGHCGDTTH